MTDLLIVGGSQDEEQALRSALGTVLPDGSAAPWPATIKSLQDTAELIAADSPSVVAIGSALDDRALDLARHLERTDPLITTILLAEPDLTTLKAAIEVGVREVIAPGATQRETADALRRAFEAGAARRATYDGKVVDRLGRRIITVISAKGGSGKTLISSNLAAALALQHPKQTVLVDLDLQFGDAATALLLSPVHTMSDAAAVPAEDLDAATLKVFLTRHPPSNLFVLCAPEDPALGDAISADAVGRILDVLSTEFRIVVIDTDAGFDEQTLVALERSTDIVVIVDLDVPSVRGGRKLLKTLDRLGLGAARRHIILNRSDSKVGLDIGEVADVLGVTIDIAVPSTRQAPLSFNEGRPLVTNYAKTPIAKRIVELSERFGMDRSARRQGR
jgi:pilus assembly protein CpaE